MKLESLPGIIRLLLAVYFDGLLRDFAEWRASVLELLR